MVGNLWLVPTDAEMLDDKILVVDDEHDIADLIEVYLENENYTAYRYYSSKDALDCIEKEETDKITGLILGADDYITNISAFWKWISPALMMALRTLNFSLRWKARSTKRPNLPPV